MLRNILICRHAEALSARAGQPDFDRPLSPQGLRQVQEGSAWLQQRGQAVEQLYASPARRTEATARVLAQGLRLQEDHLIFDPGFYLTSHQELHLFLARLPTSLTAVVLVGHNPALSYLAMELTGRQDLFLDTAGIVHVQLELPEWKDVLATEGFCVARFRAD